MSENLETNNKDNDFVNEVPKSEVKQKNCHKKSKNLNKNIDRRHRRPDMKLYVPPKAKNSGCVENDINCSEEKTFVEDLNQKTCETIESLSELEITNSGLGGHENHENHKISSNVNQLKPLSEDCVNCSLNSTQSEELMSASGESKDMNDETSWDSLFDENGDCVQQEFVQRVNQLIDNRNSGLKLEKSSIDYFSFQYNDPEVDNSEFGHILEVYDFAIELKTQDIMTCISVFNCRDFDIKWVDDSHALVVFSNTNAATEALKYIYPNMKLRPLSQGIRESKLKARKCSEFLQPFKQRPQTSASLARRLVTQSLGLRERITPEQRAAERKKLADAKERKRMALKQGQDVWDGNVS